MANEKNSRNEIENFSFAGVRSKEIADNGFLLFLPAAVIYVLTKGILAYG